MDWWVRVYKTDAVEGAVVVPMVGPESARGKAENEGGGGVEVGGNVCQDLRWEGAEGWWWRENID